MIEARNGLSNPTRFLVNVPLVAGSLLLPPQLAALLPVLGFLPLLGSHSRTLRPTERWSRVAQSVMGVMVAHAWGRWGLSGTPGEWGVAVALAGSALSFTLITTFPLEAMIIRREAPGKWWADSATCWAGLTSLIGALLADIGMAKPAFLVLAPVMLFLLHRVARSAHPAHGELAASIQALPVIPAQPRTRVEQRPAPGRPALGALTLWTTVGLGFLGLLWSLISVIRTSPFVSLVLLLVLAVVGELLKVQVYEGNRQKISLSFTGAVAMAAVTMLPLGAPLVNLVASLVHGLLQRQKRWDKWLFNVGNPVLAATVTSLVYLVLNPVGKHFQIGGIAAAVVAVAVYHVVNLGIVAVMISIHSGRPFGALAREMAWTAPTSVVLGLTGAFLGAFHTQLGLVGSFMFVLPLVILRYSLQLYARKSEESIVGLEKAKAEVEAANHKQVRTLASLIETLSALIDARDNSMHGHSQQVAKYALALGEELSLDREQLDHVYKAGLLHDLGKMGVPEAILLKPARLSPTEYEVVKKHAGLGGKILSEVPSLETVAYMVAQHHEKYDGTGYPLGLAAEGISIGGRILTVADTLDSIISDRPYRKGSSLAVALAELERCAGTQFDPAVVAAARRLSEARPREFFANSAHKDTFRLEMTSNL